MKSGRKGAILESSEAWVPKRGECEMSLLDSIVKMYPYAMVFDVESVGLHGEGFAVGYVVVDLATFSTEDENLFACSPIFASGTSEDFVWVQKNVPALGASCSNPIVVRYEFWNSWIEWSRRGAMLVADCGWPVEARFLRDCIADNPGERSEFGPYPLHDLASMMLMAGMYPLDNYPRLESELPVHNPLMDARQSARLMLECLAEID